MDPITTAVPVQPNYCERPWEGLGFRMEAVPGGAPAGVGGEGGDGGGQGDDGGFDGLIDLSSYPAELHDVARGIAKQVQGNVTKSFQEHADFRKTWEPFSQVEGLSDTDPEQLTELLQFAQIAGDPGQFDQWLDQTIGLLAEQQPDRAEALLGRLAERGLLDGEGEGEGDEEAGGLDAASMREMFSEMLDERLGPVEQHITQTTQQGREAAAKQAIGEALKEVEGAHQGTKFDADAVQRLALTFDKAEDAKGAIEAGYKEWLRITGQAEGELIDEKLGQPGPGPGNGRADTTPEHFSHDDPRLKDAMRARMRAG